MARDDIPESTGERSRMAREAWETNAAYWDERMGEGNRFHRELLGPAIERLLDVQPGRRILDAGCGNGQLSRRLADLGATVVAFDVAPTMIERARARSKDYAQTIDYRVVDATDREALRALDGPFDDVACNMALMDIADIMPLIEVGRELLRPGGPFVFSVQHPCFNSSFSSLVSQARDQDSGAWTADYFVTLSGYKESRASLGEAMLGQPAKHIYFHRPLEELLGAFFDAGYALDGLQEPTFAPPDTPDETPSWRNVWRIPPVLVARMRSA